MNATRNILVLTCVVVAMCTASDVKADFTFGPAVYIGSPVNSWYDDLGVSVSPDGLSLYFGSARPEGYGNYDLWVATRASKDDAWGTPMNLGSTVNSSAEDGDPKISTDELSLYFCSKRSGGQGGLDLWVTTRPGKGDPWGTPVNLGPTINTEYSEDACHISADGLSLFFDSDRPGGQGNWDIWVATRPTTGDPWNAPANLGTPVNGPYSDGEPSVSADGRMLFLTSNRPGGCGGFDIWMASRRRRGDPWGEPTNPGYAVNWEAGDVTSAVSSDGTMLYFAGDSGYFYGGYDLFQAPILPLVDFQDDGATSVDDLIVLMGHWGGDEQAVDIGPMPWGDGVVDFQDVAVFVTFWEPWRNVVPVTGEDFDEIVLNSDVPVLVDFSASWCPASRSMYPVIQEIANEYRGRAKVCMVDVDYSWALALQYGVEYVPTFLLFDDGQTQNTWVGVVSKEELASAIDSLL